MKKILSILLVISLVFPISILADSSNIIPNTVAGIPDKHLYQSILIQLNKRKGETFTQEEADSIIRFSEDKAIYSEQKKISSLKGIEKLSNLESLYIEKGNLSDISGIEKLTNIKYLGFYESKLSRLPDMTKMITLESLNLSFNYLTAKEIKTKLPQQLLVDSSWLDRTIWSQNVKRQILLTNPKGKKKITEKTKTIKGITHPKAIIILTTNAEKIDPFYGYDKKVVANSKGEFTLKGLDLDSYKPRRKIYIHELIRDTIYESEAKLVKTISFIPKKVQKIKKFIKLIQPKNKSEISIKTKKIVGKTDKNAIVQLKTRKGNVLSRKRASKKGNFTLKNLRLQKYKNKTLYLCEYIAKKGKKKKCVIKKGFKVR